MRNDLWAIVLVVLAVVVGIAAYLALDPGRHGDAGGDSVDTSTQPPSPAEGEVGVSQGVVPSPATDAQSLVDANTLWIGMRADQIRAALGEPDEVSRTSPMADAPERWTYIDYGMYLYVVSGELVAIRD